MLASLRSKDIFEYLVLHLARKDTLYDRLRLLRILSLWLGPLEVVVHIIIGFEGASALTALGNAISEAHPHIGRRS